MNMTRKAGMMVLTAALAMGISAGTAAAADMVLRVNVNASDGTKVEVSAPLSLLDVLKTNIPGPVPFSMDEMVPLVDELVQNLETMKGQDIVRVEGEDEIRVSVAEADSPKDLNFLRVFVKPAGGGEPTIHFTVPKGLIILASHIGNKFVEAHGDEFFSHMGHRPAPPKPPKPAVGEVIKIEPAKPMTAETDPEIDIEELAKRIQAEIMESILKELRK